VGRTSLLARQGGAGRSVLWAESLGRIRPSLFTTF
jgi:hypothetical protein